MNTEYVWTEDQTRLMGMHYPGRNICVLEIHGMSGSFLENYYADILGKKLADAGYGFIYGHNRGYGHVNDISTKPTKIEDNGWHSSRFGAVYELFEDCPKDISAWINKAKELGYSKIILMGHSLGCNKTVYYLSSYPDPDIVGVILASPPDMVGLVELEKYQPNHQELLIQARDLVAAGTPRELVKGKVWDFYTLSAQTYLSLFKQDGAADNLPVLRNPEVFDQLSVIEKPILAIMGEHDDIEIRNLTQDLELIKSKAVSCADFEIKFVGGANHDYQNREDDFANTVLTWVEAKANSISY